MRFCVKPYASGGNCCAFALRFCVKPYASGGNCCAFGLCFCVKRYAGVETYPPLAGVVPKGPGVDLTQNNNLLKTTPQIPCVTCFNFSKAIFVTLSASIA